MTFSEFKTAAAILASSVAVAKSAPVAVWWEQIAGEEERWRVVRDGNPVDDIVCPRFRDAKSPALSADGRRCGYVAYQKSSAVDQDEIYAVVDGKKNGPYKNVWGFRFSPDGKHCAYAASDGTKETAWSYYLDGKAFSPTFESVYPPVFSSERAHVAWCAESKGKLVLAVDGNEVAAGDEKLWSPVFDKAGIVSCIVKDGDRVIRCSMPG